MRSALIAIALLVVVVVVVVIAAAIYAIWRRRRRGPGKEKKSPPIDHLTATPSERLIGLSGSLRDALVDRFGPAYRARTVEELFADNQLGELLGAERLEQLTRFLLQVDQLKFAPERTPRDPHAIELKLADWTPRVENLETQIRAKPTASRANKRRRPFSGAASNSSS
jgi:hypothetical protein